MSERVLSMYIVGIDIANSHAGFLKLMEAVRKLDAPAEFGMEATGHYWLSLYAHLRQADQNVHVIRECW